MTALRIFISYASADTAFATQLITDLQASGAEIITDSPDLEDFEQFLREKLPECQQFIVVQTPEALQSARVQATVEAALKHVQEGRMNGALRVLTGNPNVAKVVPPTWAMTPPFDASQDYPRTLARLCSHLGLRDANNIPQAPLPASYRPANGLLDPTGAEKKLLLAAPPSAQRLHTEDRPLRPLSHSQVGSDTKDRPLRPLSHSKVSRRMRFTFLSLAAALVLVIAGVTVSIHQSSALGKSHQSAPLAANPTPIPSPTPSPTVPPSPTALPPTPTIPPSPTAIPPINAANLTPTQLYDAVTQRPTVYSSNLSQEDSANWDQGNNTCEFGGSTYNVSVGSKPGYVVWQPCFEHTFSVTDFAFQAHMTFLSGSGTDGGGLLFRNGTAGYYFFHIGLNGSYVLGPINLSGTTSAIHTGINQTNLLTVIAQGPLIFLYVNQQYIAQTRNTFSSQGAIGFGAIAFNQPTNVSFTNTKVWEF